jgi:hypothetical protein
MLEENGIPSVVMGCAKDIVEHVGVPRFSSPTFRWATLRVDPTMSSRRTFTLELALRVLEHAPAPRTTVQSPLRWSESADWKLDYCNVERLAADEIRRRRAEFDAAKSQAKERRDEVAGI